MAGIPANIQSAALVATLVLSRTQRPPFILAAQQLPEHSCATQEEQRYNPDGRERRTEDIKDMDVRLLLDLEVKQQLTCSLLPRREPRDDHKQQHRRKWQTDKLDGELEAALQAVITQ